jgi:RNA polymerase sigma factor
MIELKAELQKWGITFVDLVEASPKQEKLRELYKKATYFVVCRHELANTVLQKKYFPIKEVEKGTGISRKKLERGRKYIIASIIILTGDFDYIRGFLGDFE